MQKSEYFDLVDEKQWEHWKNSDERIEIDEEFLFFDDLYKPASEIIPKTYTVIDLGGYVGVQAVLFQNHKKYIDVDIYENVFAPDSGVVPPARYKQDNSEHIQSSIQSFLAPYISKEKTFPENTVILSSAVPSYEQVVNSLKDLDVNWCVWYPCEDAAGNGKLGKQIAKEVNIRCEQNQVKFKFERA